MDTHHWMKNTLYICYRFIIEYSILHVFIKEVLDNEKTIKLIKYY